MSLLGRDDAWDNLMRIKSERFEISFWRLRLNFENSYEFNVEKNK